MIIMYLQPPCPIIKIIVGIFHCPHMVVYNLEIKQMQRTNVENPNQRERERGVFQ
jgi:hypothetical protein